MARFWICFLAAGFLVALSLSLYPLSSLSSDAILASMPPTRLSIPSDASPSDGAGGPGAFFFPNTRFIFGVTSIYRSS